jgi:hypothetical protein
MWVILEYLTKKLPTVITLSPHPFVILTTMDRVVAAAVIFTSLGVAYRLYRRYTGISLADVPGPESASFFMGMYISFC